MKYVTYVVVVGSALACLATAQAETYSGSLLYIPPPGSTDGIIVGDSGGLWATNKVAFSWTVTNEDPSYPGYPWKYEYHVTQESGQAGFSHLTIETSDGFTASDLAGLTGATLLSVGTQQSGSGNPGMPADLDEIRVAPTSTPGNWTVSAHSDRMPVWGDFYTRGGDTPVRRAGSSTGPLPTDVGYDNYAYNGGFTSADLDPAAAAQSGSVDYHILRPDTHAPEPATIVNLAVLGVVALGAYVWRRRKAGNRLA